jgi:hypothetical protein
LDAAITHRPGAFAFRFLTSHIQQAAPRPGVIEVPGAAMAFTTGSPTLTLTYKNYPAPPRGFVVDESVQTLGELFLLTRKSPLVLLYIAYSMATCLEYSYGSLAEAARRLAISQNLLARISELATARGAGAEVRKFDQEYNEPRCRKENVSG